MLAAALPLIGASPAGRLEVAVEGLRSAKGQVRVCLTTDPARFPKCQGDPDSRRLVLSASDATAFRFDDLPTADYALALIHDENANTRLDTRFGMPVEGFGFSNNPAIRFGPPRFSSARIAVGGGEVSRTVKVRYFL